MFLIGHNVRSICNNILQNLQDIWNGERYVDLRRAYVDGSHGPCRRCPWRTMASRTSAGQVPVRGWHPSSQDPAQWSERNAAIGLLIPPAVERVVVAGILPPGARGTNTLSIAMERSQGATVTNSTSELLPFEVSLATRPEPEQSASVVRFKTSDPFCPAERNAGPDLRRLGFAMTGVSFVYERRRVRKVEQALRMLRHVEKVSLFKRLRIASLSPQGHDNRGLNQFAALQPHTCRRDFFRATVEAHINTCLTQFVIGRFR